MSRLTVESMPNPFQQQNQVSSPLDIVLLGLRESVPYSIVVAAVHSLVIKRYNEMNVGSGNGTYDADDLQQFSDPRLIFSRVKKDLFDILLGGFNALQLKAKTHVQYTFLVMCVFMASTWKHKGLQRMPKAAWKRVSSLLTLIRNCLIELISPPKDDNSSPCLTPATTASLDFSVVVLHFSSLDRVIRKVVFKLWPHILLLPSVKSLNLTKQVFTGQSIRCQWLLLSALSKHAKSAESVSLFNSKIYQSYWRSTFKKSIYEGALYVYDSVPSSAKQVQSIAILMLIESAIYRTSAPHFDDVINLVGLNFESGILKEEDPRHGLCGWGSTSNIRKPICNNGKTLLKTASKWMQVWDIEDLFVGPLKKCEELVILFQMLKAKRWHAASEYCESSSDQDQEDRAHLAAVLDIAKKEYTVKILHAKHGDGVPEDLAPLLKDATLEDVKAWRQKAADVSLQSTLEEQNILWIDNIVLVQNMANDLKGVNVIGIDLEWRDPAPVSLLQVAHTTKSYLIDVRKAAMKENHAFHSALSTVLKQLLVSSDTIKCVFGGKLDFRRLAIVFPLLATTVDDINLNMSGSVSSIVDLSLPPLFPMNVDNPGPIEFLLPAKCEEYRQLYNKYVLKEQMKQTQTQDVEGSGRRYRRRKHAKNKPPVWQLSLTGLCEGVFGSGLDKTEQCSNWERRPLRRQQILYAANDAHVLVRLYTKYVELKALGAL